MFLDDNLYDDYMEILASIISISNNLLIILVSSSVFLRSSSTRFSIHLSLLLSYYCNNIHSIFRLWDSVRKSVVH